jgi:hypothetical protein
MAAGQEGGRDSRRASGQVRGGSQARRTGVRRPVPPGGGRGTPARSPSIVLVLAGAPARGEDQRRRGAGPGRRRYGLPGPARAGQLARRRGGRQVLHDLDDRRRGACRAECHGQGHCPHSARGPGRAPDGQARAGAFASVISARRPLLPDSRPCFTGRLSCGGQKAAFHCRGIRAGIQFAQPAGRADEWPPAYCSARLPGSAVQVTEINAVIACLLRHPE